MVSYTSSFELCYSQSRRTDSRLVWLALRIANSDVPLLGYHTDETSSSSAPVCQISSATKIGRPDFKGLQTIPKQLNAEMKT